MIKSAIKQQYHASIAMLTDCVKQCPDALWEQGEFPRTFARIALHAGFFTQLYMGQNEAAFVPWPDGPADYHAELEPYGLPAEARVLTQDEAIAYFAYIDSLVDATVDGLDLETEDAGFSWYKNINKLSHQLMNLRHTQGHVGQLSELLMAQGIDTPWLARG